MPVNHIVVDKPGVLFDFLKDPRKYGAFETGSRKFLCNTVKSDYDYCITVENFVKQVGKTYQTGESDYDHTESEFQSMKFLYDNMMINIILVNEFELKVWGFATKCFTLLMVLPIFNQIIYDKKNRVELFEVLKKIRRSIK